MTNTQHIDPAQPSLVWSPIAARGLSIGSDVMKTDEQNRVRRARDRKAQCIRAFRTTGIVNSAVRELARMQHGAPGRVEPETLGDYWLCEHKSGALGAMVGDSEHWEASYLVPSDWTDEQIADRLGVMEYYGGPGRGYSSYPYVQRGPFHTLVRWSGGLDI